jgi:mannosyltransferase OCH1-like enzyme
VDRSREILVTQFWHSDAPPADVARSMRTWRRDPAFRWRVFDERTADEFIAAHCDRRTLLAYRSCAVPAMQADMLRYAALWVDGGVYVDVNLANRGGAAAIFDASAARGCLFLRGEDEEPPSPGRRPGRITNALMFARRPRDPLLGRALARATDNVLARLSNNVWEVTGPGVLTEVWQADDAEADRLLADFTIRPLSSTSGAIGARWLSHKGSDTDWRRFLHDPSAGSIFREPQPEPRTSALAAIRTRLGRRRVT